MPVPTVTNLFPANGHTAGHTLVRILGGGFATQTDGTAPSVRVTFGGKESPQVQVVNDALLYARTPKSPLSAAVTGDGAGAVDVSLANLDSNGDPVPGEEVTVADAFTYERTDLTAESWLTRVVRYLLLELKRQVIANTLLSQHTDYDSDTGDGRNLVDLAELPAVVLIGPRTPENRFYSTNELQETVDGDTIVRHKAPLTVDVVFDLLGIADKAVTLLNLHHAVNKFFHDNKFLEVPLDPSDPDSEVLSYEMDFETGLQPTVNGAPTESNVRNFTSTIVVRGVDISLTPGITDGDDPATYAVDRVAPASEGVVLTTPTPIGEE